MTGFFRSGWRHPEFGIGVREMLPAAPGIAAWALMTGVAMVKSGLGTPESLLMSLLVFAGSAQLAATPLLLAGAPVWVVLATAFCVNLRFVVFSAHLRPYVMQLPLRQRLVSGYFTADLTYVMFVRRHPQPAPDAAGLQGQQAYIAGHGLINWLSWTVFCVLGIALSQMIPTRWGLGLAGTLALVGILCSLITSRLRALAALAASVVSVAAYALPLRLNILLAIGAAVLLCLALEREPVPVRPVA